METFVSRSLTKILKASKGQAKLKELRASCDGALARIQAAREAGEKTDDAAAWRSGVAKTMPSRHVEGSLGARQLREMPLVVESCAEKVPPFGARGST